MKLADILRKNIKDKENSNIEFNLMIENLTQELHSLNDKNIRNLVISDKRLKKFLSFPNKKFIFWLKDNNFSYTFDDNGIYSDDFIMHSLALRIYW